MSEIIPFRPQLPKSDTFWAVIAVQGKRTVIASVYATRSEAEADHVWRVDQVRTYGAFMRSERVTAPVYRVEQIRRSDLPRNWAPLPALGALCGRLI
ncbi:hypothetical protein HKD22_10375 [Gluconobacter kanchanaburiensis]|nr:hypothetical protein [Gluconobacter kanchanaburiensis]